MSTYPRTSNRTAIWDVHSVGLILIYFADTMTGNILVTGVFWSMAPPKILKINAVWTINLRYRYEEWKFNYFDDAM